MPANEVIAEPENIYAGEVLTDKADLPLVAFNFLGSQSHRHAARSHSRFNKMGFVATIAVHVLVAAALLFQWQHKKPAPIEPMIFVQLTQVKAETPIPTPPAPKIEQPKIEIPRIELPNIIPQPNAITPKPVKVTPPQAAPAINAIESYQAKLMRHLAYFKGYPATSRKRNETGTATVTVTIDARGNVLSSQLISSSGHKLLDDEALNTVRRASPLPVPPPEIWADPMQIDLPIRFLIR